MSKTTPPRPRRRRNSAKPTLSPEATIKAIEELRGQERVDSIVLHYCARNRSGISKNTYFKLLRSMPAAEQAWTRYEHSDFGRFDDEPLAPEDDADFDCREFATRGSGESVTVIVGMWAEASDGRTLRLEFERGDWGTIVDSRGPFRVHRRTAVEQLPPFPVPVPAVPPPVPAGFVKCEVCGEYSDTTSNEQVKCRCKGPFCRRCGTNRINKPGSNSYDETTGRIEHWPGFSGMMPCTDCRTAEANALARIWPSPTLH